MEERDYVFSTGFNSLDDVLQGLRPGDNVVWQTRDMERYQTYVEAFSARGSRHGGKLVYFRFAEHPPLIPDDVPADRHHFDPEEGFETFANNILRVIEENGEGACYIFDCLSNLAVDWTSDRMLGNFFMLACPLLYRLNTLAYFVLLRNDHGPLAVDAIHNTAQVVLELYRGVKNDYILPIKVEGRHSKTLYMLHRREEDEFIPEVRSAAVSRILSKVPQPWLDFTIDRPGIWTNTFIKAYRTLERLQSLPGPPPVEAEQLKDKLIKMIITRDEALFQLSRQYFGLDDLIAVAKRMVCTGLVGGKSVGMLLARAILAKHDPRWVNLLETHDSFYIGADVFYTYLIQNGCWWGWRSLKQTTAVTPEVMTLAGQLNEKLLGGVFPEDIMERFKAILAYYGQFPLIVRSSSLLEDGYGNAFSGKYESHFCVNQGDPRRRLEDFVMAIKKVYASTVSEQALSYRAHKKLMGMEEQMALLVQRVSGELRSNYYFPQIAGVAYSFNPFVWNKRIDPAQGVLRLVYGLGTRAVDRHDNDYTRIVAINEPYLRPESSEVEAWKHTQKVMDVLDLNRNEQVSMKFQQVASEVEDSSLELFASRDEALLDRARAMGLKNPFPWALTFDRFLRESGFIRDMGEILRVLERAYGRPVDVEFTTNFIAPDCYRINIVQCRPFHFTGSLVAPAAPRDVPPEDLLLRSHGPIIGQSLFDNVDRIIHVKPEKYGLLPVSDRYSIARLIGELSAAAPSLKTMLVGPGRWGSSMPSLGVPVSFSEIRNVSVLCEINAMHDNLTPETSLGTHFFNDLVEMDIVYMALKPGKDGAVLNPAVWSHCRNLLPELAPSATAWQDTVTVFDTRSLKPGHRGFLYANTLKQEAMVFLDKDTTATA